MLILSLTTGKEITDYIVISQIYLIIGSVTVLPLIIKYQCQHIQ